MCSIRVANARLGVASVGLGVAMALGYGATACSAGSGAVLQAVPFEEEESGPQPPFEVVTTAGRVIGVDATGVEGVRAYLGIPYASTGPERWQLPVPVAPWWGLRDASQAGPSCLQVRPRLSDDVSSVQTMGVEDDCLSVNIWSPIRPAGAPRAPVMVWIHGGGFISGGNSDETYWGDDFARETGAVLVSINYRLGPLGFLAHPNLPPESGNLGLRDQQMALQWVQQNIERFGGDPANVTLFGQSTGSVAVCTHLFAPGSRGLFQRVILQSGTCFDLRSRQRAEAVGEQYARHLCPDGDDEACLYSATPDALIRALAVLGDELTGRGEADAWGPIYGGDTVPENPRTAQIDSSYARDTSLMLGSVLEEGRLFVVSTTAPGFGFVPVTSDESYEENLRVRFGADADLVLKRYPASAYASSPTAALAQVITDHAFACPARRLARRWEAAGGDAFLYVFTRPLTDVWLSDLLGVFHLSESPFLFDQPFLLGRVAQEDRGLISTMRGYWSSFASQGIPTAENNPDWPVYRPTADRHLVLDLQPLSDSSHRSNYCDFWDTLQN